MRIVAGCSAIVVAVLLAGSVDAAARERIFAPLPYIAAGKVIRLAKIGDPRAQARLGWMYETGRGVPQNYYEAAKWYYAAADRGNGFAQLHLGLMYNKGQGVHRDYVRAEMWFNLAASQSTGDDRDYAARLRDALASKMTTAQLAAAQDLATAWYRAR